MEQFANIIDDSCMICCDDIINNNVVFYKINNNWIQYNICKDCTIKLLNTKWFDYINMIKNADCEKALKSLLEINIPSKLTVTTTFYSESIDELYFDSQYKSSELIKKDINITELQNDFRKVYTSIINDTSYDYISEIKFIMNKYVL
jgi:hypothetical protein